MPRPTALVLGCLTSLLILFTSAMQISAADEAGTVNTKFADAVAPFLKKHCNSCHSGKEPKADLGLDQFVNSSAIGANRETWERVLEMVQLGEMPPSDRPRPNIEELQQTVDWLKSALADFDCQNARPGPLTIRRLNRFEYNNTIRDLTGLSLTPADDFPEDDIGNGFDNIGAVLSIPPILMEKYVSASEIIVEAILADPTAKQRILFCRPGNDLSEQECARRILRRFATRAYRRPVTDAELDRLLTVLRGTREQAESFEQNLKLGLQIVLMSPHFLFRVELDGPQTDSDLRPLNGYELATRLSYFLWSSMPDEELFELAKSGELQKDTVLVQQIDRMLSDRKAQAFVTSFGGQWLELRQLTKISPDPERFPGFDEELRSAMQRETEMFFESVVKEDRSVLDFLDADDTFMNERLAEHYGETGVTGSEFRRVTLSDARRGGILTQASILTLTSNPTRTSPVKRGKWILTNILGTPPLPPPAGVEELKDDGEAELLGSLRERTEQHRANPACAVCHNRMDPLGFGFENFDAVGAWREKDGRFEVDPSGELPGKLAFQGPKELRQILKTTKSKPFVRCLTEKLMTYALGRGIEDYDRCAVDEIVERADQHEHRFSSLIAGIVLSDPFRMRATTQGDQK